MSGYDIELATAADLGRLVAIRHAAFAAQAPSAYSPEEVRTLLGDVDEGELRAMVEAGQLFVARAGPDVVGLAGWRGDRLRHVYVDPGHTRRGIASALLDRVEADFRRRTGRTEIRAGVALHAEAFYVASGYELVARARAWDGSAYLEMRKGG